MDFDFKIGCDRKFVSKVLVGSGQVFVSQEHEVKKDKSPSDEFNMNNLEAPIK